MLKGDEIEIIKTMGELSPREFFDLYRDAQEKLDSISDRDDPEYSICEQYISDLRYWRCATDLELFSLYHFPHYCKFPFNGFHYDTFDNYEFGERNIRRADSAPRGFAKSTIKALIKPIHDVCYKLEKYIIIASNTKPQSVQKLKDIKGELLANESLLADYGNFFQGKKAAGSEDYIAYSGNHKCRLQAIGAGTEVRGVRFGDVRPTKIIVDDGEHSHQVENEAIREKMEGWYKEVISKIGDENTNIEFIGTVLHQKSLLKTLIKNPKYSSREYQAIISWADNSELWQQWKEIYINLDNDNRRNDALKFFKNNEAEMLKGTEVLWPEKEPYYMLQEEIIETGYRAFMKEKQNDPLSSEEKPFSPQDTHYFKEEGDYFIVERSGKKISKSDCVPAAAIDPATGQTKPTTNKKPDFASISVGHWHEKSGRLFINDAWLKRQPPSKQIAKIFDFNELYGLYKMGVETNLFRDLLIDNIKAEKKRLENERRKRLGSDEAKIDIKFIEIDLRENKEKRIYALEPKVFQGKVLFSRSLPPEYMDQLFDFPFASHDDGPDSLEMLYSICDRNYRSGAVKARAGR